jgi:hypothetical protein
VQTIHAEFLAYKESVPIKEFHQAMAVIEYYVKRRFQKDKYPAGMSEDPVLEIAKAIRSNKIKAFFVAGEEFEVHTSKFAGHLQAEVMVWPPFYLSMQQFRTVMQEAGQDGGADGNLQVLKTPVSRITRS